METAIFIHGYTLFNLDRYIETNPCEKASWENIVWGKPQDGILGRIPMGIAMAIRFNAKMIVLSSGGSFINSPKDKSSSNFSKNDRYFKKNEPTFIHNFIDEKKHELFSSKRMMDLAGSIDCFKKKVLQYIHSMEIEVSANTTLKEIVYSIQRFPKEGFDVAIGISSPSHTARCMALRYWPQSIKAEKKQLIYFCVPSETDFAKGKHPIVFEPKSNLYLNNKLDESTIFQRWYDSPEKERQRILAIIQNEL